MTSTDVGWGRAAGGRAGCGGGELVEITSQLHRALPCLDQPWLQWEEPADYSGWLNHPSITWNFHTQPSINISPPPVKEEISNIVNNRASLFFIMIYDLVSKSKLQALFFPSLCFMVESTERWRFIWNWISEEIWNKNVAFQFCLASCPRLFAHIIILDLERQHCQPSSFQHKEEEHPRNILRENNNSPPLKCQN